MVHSCRNTRQIEYALDYKTHDIVHTSLATREKETDNSVIMGHSKVTVNVILHHLNRSTYIHTHTVLRDGARPKTTTFSCNIKCHLQ